MDKNVIDSNLKTLYQISKLGYCTIGLFLLIVCYWLCRCFADKSTSNNRPSGDSYPKEMEKSNMQEYEGRALVILAYLMFAFPSLF